MEVLRSRMRLPLALLGGFALATAACELLVTSDDLHPVSDAAAPDAPASCMTVDAGQSCQVAGGDTRCGSSEDCCLATPVTGGTFYRGAYAQDAGGPTPTSYPATVGSFQLDRFEVTVVRFGRFLQSGCLTPA